MHKILRLSQVKQCTGLSRSTIYERIAEETFPAQIPLGGKSVGWLQHDIENWIQAQINASKTARG